MKIIISTNFNLIFWTVTHQRELDYKVHCSLAQIHFTVSALIFNQTSQTGKHILSTNGVTIDVQQSATKHGQVSLFGI